MPVLCDQEILVHSQVAEQSHVLERAPDARGHALVGKEMRDLVLLQ
jgi:hypothetical protein